jgi:hypothetical protein
MSVNLIRNAKVYFTTNVNSTTGYILTGAGAETDHSTTTTFEIQVLDGMSFSQNTTQETITLSESGAAPARGQRSFNTALDAGEWSFSTYIRPRYVEGTATAGIDNDDRVSCEENVLWNALLSDIAIGTAGAAYVETVGNATGPAAPFATVSTANSNKNQLQKFGLIIQFDNTTYFLHNCAIESASVDFGIDQIGTIAWSGRTEKIEVAATNVTVTTPGTFATGLTGTYTQKFTSGVKYIVNKLSSMTMTAPLITKFGQSSSKTYSFPITGGNLTIANNLTYLVPASVGVVNTPCAYFTGTRSISGSLTAYLRTGTDNTAGLMNDLITQSSTNDQNLFALTIGLGGTTTEPTTTSPDNKLVINMPYTMVQIPTVATEQVVSTTINFVAQGGTGTAGTSDYNITSATEMTLKYFSGPAT